MQVEREDGLEPVEGESLAGLVAHDVLDALGPLVQLGRQQRLIGRIDQVSSLLRGALPIN